MIMVGLNEGKGQYKYSAGNVEFPKFFQASIFLFIMQFD